MSRAEANRTTLREGRKLVADLLTPNHFIYWFDLLASLTVGYGLASIYLDKNLAERLAGANGALALRVICFFLGGCALYRAAIYMHEIVHFRRGEMRAFRFVWNMAAGVVMLIPSFLYESHLVHHNTHHYGTANDGEYLPLGVGRWRNLAGFLLQILLLPGFVVFRFLILTPISFLHPKLRRWVLERASSFVINFGHRREIPENAPLKTWAVIDVLCFLRVALMFTLVAVGVTHWTRLPQMYLLAMFTLGMNHLRTLVAHRYMSHGEPMSHADQLSDSVNIEGNWLTTELVFPLGLRYHALHHLFPSIPYHNLGRAHRRLMQNLPADSPYREITYPSFFAAVGELAKNIRLAIASGRPGADEWYDRRRELARAESAPHVPESENEDDDQGNPNSSLVA